MSENREKLETILDIVIIGGIGASIFLLLVGFLTAEGRVAVPRYAPHPLTGEWREVPTYFSAENPEILLGGILLIISVGLGAIKIIKSKYV
ncbi:hypothetical protein B6U74_06250 [Candidatus Bathyarchaeota archaeon ex4484_205]|nr:MAG: hypothetical protein B6U74_06250 [Candidatus Bathyarchaeota archaeon ex4484_205]RLG69056.1 MAG: hypothetical protein DRN93_01165 [archaeon]HDN17591.1 hypothetical protein [Candidatus Bathyarchaeota archaeon]